MSLDSILDRLRPNAGHGLWLSGLVPLCYCLNRLRHADSVEFQFEVSTVVAAALFVQSWLHFDALGLSWFSPRTQQFPRLLRWSLSKLILTAVTALPLWLGLAQSFPFSLFAALVWPLLFEALFWHALRSMPGNFSLGEATIVVQAFVLLLLNTFLRLVRYAQQPPVSQLQQLTVVVQLTLLGTALIVGTLQACPRRMRPILFYPLTLTVGAIVMAFPVAGPASTAIGTLLWFVCADFRRLLAIALAVGLLGSTAAAIAWFVACGDRRSSTRTRKYFHLLVVAVFVPGLLYEYTLLFVTAGMLLAAFVLLEAARLVQLWPISEALQLAVGTFIDAQDAAGPVALTPIYLLAGCALPMWLHPFGAAAGDWAGSAAAMALSAGVLSVGIGDAAASVCGSLYGRHKWPGGGNKSLEGTAGAVLAQALLVPFYVWMGVFRPSPLQLVGYAVTIVTNSIAEARTDQIDNLVLPLITYAMLTLT